MHLRPRAVDLVEEEYGQFRAVRQQRARFDAHLRECPECAAYLASYRTTLELEKLAFDHPDDPVPGSVPEGPFIVDANSLVAAEAPAVSLYGDAGFGVLTLHRPSNVDEASSLGRNLELVLELSQRLPIVFPVHPRTLDRLKHHGLWDRLATSRRLLAVQPLGYVDLLALTKSARLFMTDSGGIQEECCVLGTPCLTLRPNTERPATLAENGGTNYLIGSDPQRARGLRSPAGHGSLAAAAASLGRSHRTANTGTAAAGLAGAWKQEARRLGDGAGLC